MNNKIALLVTVGFSVLSVLSVSYADTTMIDPFKTEWTNNILSLGTTLILLTLAPTFMMACTSFTRIVIVFSFLRVALGTNQSPPNIVLISIAIFISIFIMHDTIQEINNTAVSKFQSGEMEFMDALNEAQVPIKKFMLKHTSAENLKLFTRITTSDVKYKNYSDIPIFVLVPSFIVTELNTAFTIGFMVFLPFIIIDIVVASVLMSMGVMMLPPVMISLPIKLIFFVSVNGWHMIIGSLIQSYT